MDSLLSLDETTVDKKKKSLPPHITASRRGPLLLQKQKLLPTSKLQQTKVEPSLRYSKERRHHSKDQCSKLESGIRIPAQTKRGFLTRYPVVVRPRPMDEIEDHLLKGDMTWSQLKYNVLMMEDGCSPTAEREGYDSAESTVLHHRMKYSSHGNDPLLAIERYTHTMSSANDPNNPAGPETINISITHTNRTQQKPLRRTSVLPTQQSSHTTILPVSWRGHFKNISPQASREKETGRLGVAREKTVPIHRPVSRASGSIVGLTNGVVKTDKCGKSTTIPQSLVKPHTQASQQPTLTHERQETGSVPSAPQYYQEVPGVDTSPSSTVVAALGRTEAKPSQSFRLYLSSHIGPSIAPPGVRAAATHRLRPITCNTMIKGKGLVTVAR